MEKVKEKEDAELYKETDQTLYYNDVVSSLKCEVYYSFGENKLDMIFISFIENHEDLNEYFNDYAGIKAGLNVKYGLPYKAEMEWNDKRYKTDKDK